MSLLLLFGKGTATPGPPLDSSSAYSILINGIDQTARVQDARNDGARRMRYSRVAGSPATLTLYTFDRTIGGGGYRPAIDYSVLVIVDGVVHFSGVITDIREEALTDAAIGWDVGILCAVTCADKNGLLLRDSYSQTYADGTTVKQVLQDLIATPLAGRGITLDPTQANGPPLTGFKFEDAYLDDILNSLTTITGWIWDVTAGSVLSMIAPGSVSCGFSLTDGGGAIFGGVTTEQGRSEGYANRVTVVYGPASQLDKTDSFTGNGVTSSWVLTYTPVIGADGFMLSRGLVNENGIDYTLGPPGGSPVYYTWTAATNTLTRVLGPLPAGQVITLRYGVQFPLSYTANNTAEQTAHGIYTRKYIAEDVTDLATASQLATGLLSRSIASPLTVAIAHRKGLAQIGRSVNTVIAERNVNATLMITEVEFWNEEDGRLTYAIQAVSGGAQPDSWVEFFKRGWAGAGASSSPASISGAILPGISGLFNLDVVANAGILADEASLRHSNTGGISNSSTLGPGLLLGRPDATWAWGLVANYIHCSLQENGGSGRRSLCFMYAPEAIGSNGTAMELSKDDNNTASVYYLTCPPASTLNLGASSTIISNGSRINNLYGSAFEFLSTGICRLFSTRPELKFNDSFASRFGRIQQFTAAQIALTQNLRYTGSQFDLDDTALSGWFARLMDSSNGDRFSVERASAGSNPRTMAPKLIMFASGCLSLSHTVDAGGIGIVLPNGSTYCSLNAAGSTVIGLMQLDASNRLQFNLNSAALLLSNPLTSTTASAGAQTLPANPVGFLNVSLDGGTTTRKIPYYAN